MCKKLDSDISPPLSSSRCPLVIVPHQTFSKKLPPPDDLQIPHESAHAVSESEDWAKVILVSVSTPIPFETLLFPSIQRVDSFRRRNRSDSLLSFGVLALRPPEQTLQGVLPPFSHIHPPFNTFSESVPSRHRCIAHPPTFSLVAERS